MGARTLTEWVVLGSGAFQPGPREVRNPAGYALARGKEVLLFDLGFGDFKQLIRAGLDPDRITHVFFSHLHPDHVGDLTALLFAKHIRGRIRGRRAGTLRLFGPRGFSSFLRRLRSAHGRWLEPRGDRMIAEDLSVGTRVSGPGWSVVSRSVPHSITALAYRFDSPEASVVYSGDTGYDPGLAEFAKGVDLFVIEATLTDGDRYPHHLRVRQAIDIFRASGASRGLLTHLSAASAAEASRRVPGNTVHLAADLMRIRLG